jgi:tight adherence protein C
MYLYLVIGFVFIACFLLFYAINLLVSRKSDPVEKRLKTLIEIRDGEREETKEEIEKREEGLLNQIISGLNLFDPNSVASKRTALLLAQAGYQKEKTLSTFYAAKILSFLILGAVVVLLGMFLRWKSSTIVLLAVIAGIVGYNIPRAWLTQKMVRRREQIRRAVPNILDLLVVCVEAGLSVNAAIQKIGEETKRSYPAMSDELHLLNQEILIGKTRAEAFRNLGIRTGVDELRALATMLLQSDKLGTSIASTLRVQADALRTKRYQMAEEAAHKMPVKLVFPLVLFIFPELLVIILGPAVIQLTRTLAQMGK